MRTSLYGTLAAASLVLCQPAAAEEPAVAAANAAALFHSNDARLDANKQIAYRIINDLILNGRWDTAGSYLAHDYIEHNPNVPSGLDGQRVYFLKQLSNRPPGVPTSIEGTIVSVTAEDNRVVVTSLRNRKHPDDPAKKYTISWFDMWRIEDGKAVEHWDASVRDPAHQ